MNYPCVRPFPDPFVRINYDEFQRYEVLHIVVHVQLSEHLPVNVRVCRMDEYIGREGELGRNYFEFDSIPEMLTSYKLKVAIREVSEKAFTRIAEEVRVAAGGEPTIVQATYEWSDEE